ncbi:unnamed protein product [Ranitomeya imitator]|uniref:Cytochrome P450 n=1 Tax=Ranitomeya imitator TaxID=111125 RepID=A0ABN9MJ97_9NEOB|nr:unnamed protein product [Ranitomeya imitator]
MFTLVTILKVKKQTLHTYLQPSVLQHCALLSSCSGCERRSAGKQSGDVTALLSGCPALTARPEKQSAEDRQQKLPDVYPGYRGPRDRWSLESCLCDSSPATKQRRCSDPDRCRYRCSVAMCDGLITSEGHRWRQLKRFTLTTLRNFGVGKRTIEDRIKEECSILVEELTSYKGREFDAAIIITKAVSNVICSVVFGRRFQYDDARFHRMLDIFYETFELMSSSWAQIQDMIPMIMNHIPGPHQKITLLLEELNDFIAEQVKLNQQTLDQQSPRDYIDCFLVKMQEEKDNPESEFNMRNLILTLNNLFFAGGETVSTTLKHGFLVLLRYPDIQAKIHKEIDEIIGRGRQPNIDDRSKMPYTDAVIHEIQRFSSVIPMNAPHSATKDTNFRGHTIPKGTGVCALLCSVLEDPTYFSTPGKFNPNHFLDSEGNFKRNEAFVPFSLGKRLCIGEGLARMELFLFFTSILQNFVLTSQTQFTDSDIYPRMAGFANVPIPYQMSFVSR